MVDPERIEPVKINAKCVGTQVDYVVLSWEKGRLCGDCTWPAYEDFGPCKHLAVVAYAVISQQNGSYLLKTGIWGCVAKIAGAK